MMGKRLPAATRDNMAPRSATFRSVFASQPPSRTGIHDSGGTGPVYVLANDLVTLDLDRRLPRRFCCHVRIGIRCSKQQNAYAPSGLSSALCK
jgi:hypothetical protein